MPAALPEPRPLSPSATAPREPMAHLTVRVPRGLKRAAKLAAIREGVRLQVFVTAALAARLERLDA